MSANEHSFRKLLPGFVIPAGTQVVLKAAKVLPGGERFKPSGSVGIVLECPRDNQHPYLVRFTDDETVTAYFDELALRRREVEDELGEVVEDNMRPWIIYRCQVGSKAFGLAPRTLTTTCVASIYRLPDCTGHCGDCRNNWSPRNRSGMRFTGNWKNSCGWP